MNEAHTPAIDALALGGRIVPGDLPCLLCQARSSAVCGVLGEERIACLNDFVVRRRIDAGGRLFDEGDPAAHYFVVTEGAMMAFKEARRTGGSHGFSLYARLAGLNHHQRYVIPPRR